MAQNGMRFNHAYSNPICTPSRVKLMTGLSNIRNYSAFSILRRDSRTIGHMMQAAGYKTAIAGKWQLLGSEDYPERFSGKGAWPEPMGFDRHCLWQLYAKSERYWGPTVTIDGEVKEFSMDEYGPDIYCQFLLDRIEEYRDQPFFLYYPMALVHNPFLPTPDSEDLSDKAKTKSNNKYFADMVAYMDKLIGKIVAKTEELGIAERTLIMVTGDNGTNKSITSSMGDQQIEGGKGLTTDAGTHVALFAYQPGTVPAGTVCDDLMEFTDFVPTVAEATGAKPLYPTDGVSFLPQLHGRTGNPRDTIFVYYWPRPERGEAAKFVRNKRWKLYGDGRLYDVQNDILEKHPVTSPEYNSIRRDLQAAMDRMPEEGQKILQFD